MRLGPIRKKLAATLVLALVALLKAMTVSTITTTVAIRLRPRRCGFLRVAAAAVLMAPLRLTDGMAEQLTDLAGQRANGNYSVFISATLARQACWDQRRWDDVDDERLTVKLYCTVPTWKAST